LTRMEQWNAAGDELCTTELNYFEVALGIERIRNSAEQGKLSGAWAELLVSLEVIPLTRRATLVAVRRQAQLVKAGKPSAVVDLFVAATAAAGGSDLIVTNDADDFDRLGILRVERR